MQEATTVDGVAGKAGSGKELSRRAARSLAFQILYSVSFNLPSSYDALEKVFENGASVKAELPDVYAEAGDALPAVVKPEGFAWELVHGVWSNCKQLDGIIEKFSKHWKLERLGKVELTVLRLATFEICVGKDVPKRVAISEALELARQFADFKSLPFINGILDAIVKDVE